MENTARNTMLWMHSAISLKFYIIKTLFNILSIYMVKDQSDGLVSSCTEMAHAFSPVLWEHRRATDRSTDQSGDIVPR